MKLVKHAGILILLIIIYFILLIVTSLIPNEWIKENATKSSETLLELGDSYKHNNDQLFLFTDALMLNTAYSIDNNHPIESLLLDRKSYTPGQTKVVHQEGKHVQSPKMYMDDIYHTYQTKEFYGLMHDDGNTEAFEYPRYWHGYLL